MVEPETKCGYCRHQFKIHCKGGVRHANYKDEIRQAPVMRTHVCRTRHCLSPLCDCTGFKK